MEVLYESVRYCITPTTFKIGKTTYPIRNISSVTSPIKVPFNFFGGLLLNGALFLFGLWAIAQLSTGWVIGGLIAIVIGGYNVWGEFHRGYCLILNFTDGQEFLIRMNDKNEIDNFYHAVRKAIDS